MIGIRFEIPNSWGNFLSTILDNIITKDYTWKIYDEEILIDLNNDEDLFKERIYDDKNFRALILNSKYYLIMGNILAFKTNNFKRIYNYNDFIESDCELLMVIVDTIFVDIYAKNSKTIEELKNNAINNKFKNINYIYNDNSPRNIFYI